jgi:hypothetical protein
VESAGAPALSEHPPAFPPFQAPSSFWIDEERASERVRIFAQLWDPSGAPGCSGANGHRSDAITPIPSGKLPFLRQKTTRDEGTMLCATCSPATPAKDPRRARIWSVNGRSRQARPARNRAAARRGQGKQHRLARSSTCRPTSLPRCMANGRIRRRRRSNSTPAACVTALAGLRLKTGETSTLRPRNPRSRLKCNNR